MAAIPTTANTKTQVTISIEYATYDATSKRAFSEKTSFSAVVQAALEAYLLSKGKK